MPPTCVLPLHQQPEGIQTFILRTSILDRLCSPLCDAVMGSPSASGQEILEQLGGVMTAILRWLEALDAGVAPPVVLEATHERALDLVPLEVLKRHALDASQGREAP